MSLQFKVVQGDLLLHADFAEPAFGLFRNPAELHQRVFPRLVRHGLRLTDMRPEIGSGSLGDAHLHCSLFNFSTSVRIRLERVEVYCFDINRVSRKQLEELAIDVLEAMKGDESGPPFKTYSMALGLHVMLLQSTAREFVARFAATAPRNLGPLLGSGTVFYYGAEAAQVTSSVTVDLSGVLENGLFVRTHVAWDAGKLAIGSLPSMAAKHVQNAFTELGLTLSKD